MEVVRAVRDPDQLHPGDAAAPADPVQPDRAGDRARTSWQRTIAELTEILENPEQLRTAGQQSAGRDRPAARHAAAHDPAGGQRRGDHGCGCSAGGRRRPVLGAAVLRRAAGADRLMPSRCRPVGARANHDVIVSKIIGTARGDLWSDHQRRPADQDQRARSARPCPATANAPNLQGGTHVSELVSLDAGRAGALPDHAGRGFARAWPSARRRGVVKRVNPEVLGKD